MVIPGVVFTHVRVTDANEQPNILVIWGDDIVFGISVTTIVG